MQPQTETQLFFAALDWPLLEKKIAAALRDPHQAVPLETPCPAVYHLAGQVFDVVKTSAHENPGQDLTARELLNADQRLAVMRILEAVISTYEDWKQAGGRTTLTGSNSVEALVRPSSRLASMFPQETGRITVSDPDAASRASQKGRLSIDDLGKK